MSVSKFIIKASKVPASTTDFIYFFSREWRSIQKLKGLWLVALLDHGKTAKHKYINDTNIRGWNELLHPCSQLLTFYKLTMKSATRVFEELIAKDIKTNSNHFFKYIGNWQWKRLGGWVTEEWRRMNWWLRTWNNSLHLFSLWNMQATPELLVLGRVFEELNQIKVTLDQLLRKLG